MSDLSPPTPACTAPAPSTKDRNQSRALVDLAFRRRIARLLAELHGDASLTEEQCARAFGCALAAWRGVARSFTEGTSFVEGDGRAAWPEASPVDASIMAAIGAADQAAAVGEREAFTALDFLAGLHPCGYIDRADPMAGAEAIFSHVQAEISHWRGLAERSSEMLVQLANDRAEVARAKAALGTPRPNGGST